MFGILLTYWIKFSRSRKEIYYFSSHLTKFFVPLQQNLKVEWKMTYFNQFHKEAVERKLQKIEESMKFPMNSLDAANYMKHNFEMGKNM